MFEPALLKKKLSWEAGCFHLGLKHPAFQEAQSDNTAQPVGLDHLDFMGGVHAGEAAAQGKAGGVTGSSWRAPGPGAATPRGGAKTTGCVPFGRILTNAPELMREA